MLDLFSGRFILYFVNRLEPSRGVLPSFEVPLSDRPLSSAPLTFDKLQARGDLD